MGNYIMTMQDSPLFDASKETWESSHSLFNEAFPDGFAWELLEVFSGNRRLIVHHHISVFTHSLFI